MCLEMQQRDIVVLPTCISTCGSLLYHFCYDRYGYLSDFSTAQSQTASVWLLRIGLVREERQTAQGAGLVDKLIEETNNARSDCHPVAGYASLHLS